MHRPTAGGGAGCICNQKRAVLKDGSSGVGVRIAEGELARTDFGQRTGNAISIFDSSTNDDTTTTIDLYDITARITESYGHSLSTSTNLRLEG